MNLTEALNAALPDLPLQQPPKGYPKLHPQLVWREQIEQGEPTIICAIGGEGYVYRFTPQQWKLLQLCNGERSYDELAEAFTLESGAPFTSEEVREYCGELDEVGFWYKSPQEKALTLNAKLAEERHKRVKRKSKVGDLSIVHVAYWDPDKYLTWLNSRAGFFYSNRFTAAVLCGFAFTIVIFIGGWHEIWQDSLKYYNFSEKTGYDLLEFWLLFAGLGFFHEVAHALTCKHFGGAVKKMGFMLIYLSPAFFVEVTEIFVYGGKWQRLATIVAGVYTELIFCTMATFLWWGTSPGSPVHDFAYKVMLITGVAVVLMNVNPLVKIDGYYAFCELVDVVNLKERSTAFVSGWVQRHIFGLPVEVEYVPLRRRWLFIPYALLSGLYSYALLLVIARLTYNIFKHFTTEWAFVAAAFVAFLIFRSRLRTLRRFMQTVYLDKRERIRAWLSPPRIVVSVVVLCAVLFGPIWRDTVNAQFVLEPKERATIRAAVGGEVVQVLVNEAERVYAGEPVARLRNLKLEGNAAQIATDYRVAEARATQMELQYGNYGEAEHEVRKFAELSRNAAEEIGKLVLTSPISGVVVTPRPHDLTGSFLASGSQVVEVADLSTMRARIYVPEFEIRKVRENAEVRIMPDGFLSSLSGKVSSITPAPSEIQPLNASEAEYKGLRSARYYTAEFLVDNREQRLKDGLSGTAKIYAGRRSLAGFAWEAVRSFAQRKVW